MLPCKVNIVSNNLIAVVIPQFEIGLIEYLVILYVAEQFKIIVTVESPGDFIWYKSDKLCSSLSRIESANP